MLTPPPRLPEPPDFGALTSQAARSCECAQPPSARDHHPTTTCHHTRGGRAWAGVLAPTRSEVTPGRESSQPIARSTMLRPAAGPRRQVGPAPPRTAQIAPPRVRPALAGRHHPTVPSPHQSIPPPPHRPANDGRSYPGRAHRRCRPPRPAACRSHRSQGTCRRAGPAARPATPAPHTVQRRGGAWRGAGYTSGMEHAERRPHKAARQRRDEITRAGE
jgi:hypothetical protein